MRPLMSWIALAIGAVIATALLILASKDSAAPSFTAAGPAGSIQAVTLVNGQTYFGTLKSGVGGVVLTDVFDLAAETNPDSNQRTTKLIRRMTASVYGPTDLTIPADKILSLETVGRDSTVAKAMLNMQLAPPAQPDKPK